MLKKITDKYNEWTTFVQRKEVMASLIVANKKIEEKRKVESSKLNEIEHQIKKCFEKAEFRLGLEERLDEIFMLSIKLLKHYQINYYYNTKDLKILKRLFEVIFLNDVAKHSFIDNIHDEMVKIGKNQSESNIQELLKKTFFIMMKGSYISNLRENADTNFQFADLLLAHLSSASDTFMKLIVAFSKTGINPASQKPKPPR